MDRLLTFMGDHYILTFLIVYMICQTIVSTFGSNKEIL